MTACCRALSLGHGDQLAVEPSEIVSRLCRRRDDGVRGHRALFRLAKGPEDRAAIAGGAIGKDFAIVGTAPGVLCLDQVHSKAGMGERNVEKPEAGRLCCRLNGRRRNIGGNFLVRSVADHGVKSSALDRRNVVRCDLRADRVGLA